MKKRSKVGNKIANNIKSKTNDVKKKIVKTKPTTKNKKQQVEKRK